MHLPESAVRDGIDPEAEALLADSIGPALLVILHTLAPAERLAFVLHDIFAGCPRTLTRPPPPSPRTAGGVLAHRLQRPADAQPGPLAVQGSTAQQERHGDHRHDCGHGRGGAHRKGHCQRQFHAAGREQDD
jgi:hypothetical protein